MRPLTVELPKPVVPVGDRPLIAHVAAACRRAGVSSLVANAHHGHQQLAAIISSLQLDIQLVVEPEIRGTAGGVAGARALLGEGPVLVWNADILTEAPAEPLLAMAAERDAQVLAVSPRARGEGSVGLDASGGVVRLRGRVFGDEASGGDYIGVMALGPGVVAALPERGCLVGDVALPALAAGRRVWTVPSPAPWSDLGDLAAYVEANFEWLARTGRPVWRARDASVVGGVELEQCLLGAGVRVTGQGTLRRVIAWPGAPVQAPLEQAVVLSSGRVVPFDGGAEN